MNQSLIFQEVKKFKNKIQKITTMNMTKKNTIKKTIINTIIMKECNIEIRENMNKKDLIKKDMMIEITEEIIKNRDTLVMENSFKKKNIKEDIEKTMMINIEKKDINLKNEILLFFFS